MQKNKNYEHHIKNKYPIFPLNNARNKYFSIKTRMANYNDITLFHDWLKKEQISLLVVALSSPFHFLLSKILQLLPWFWTRINKFGCQKDRSEYFNTQNYPLYFKYFVNEIIQIHVLTGIKPKHELLIAIHVRIYPKHFSKITSSRINYLLYI